MKCVYTAMLVAMIPTVVLGADPKKITYEEHVRPIFIDKCVGCHSQDKQRGGLNLANYTALIQGGSSGVAVKPGDPDGSLLYLLMSHKQEPKMPPNSPALPAERLDVVSKWIAGGALENAGSKVPTLNKPKADIGLTSVIRGKPEGPPPMPAATVALEPAFRSGQPNAITALASNPWSPLVALAGHKQVVLYNSDNSDLLGVLAFPEGVPHVLKFSRTGSLLLAGGGRGGKSGKVVVWNVKTGERVIEVGEETDIVLAADVSPDQTQIALGGPGKMIRIYSTKDGKLLHEVKKHTDWVTAMEYSPDGVLLATGDRNGGLFVWEAFTAREYYSLRGHTAAITDVSWRNDSNLLISSSEDTTIRQWEMENGRQVRSWGGHGGGTLAAQYARDGRIVSTGRDRVTKVWDGNGAQQKAFEAFPDLGLKAVFSHDGGRVIAGDWSGSVRVWTVADAKAVGALQPNPPGVAEQFEAAAKELVAAVKARDEKAAVASASKAAFDKANAELAETQKLVTDGPALIKAATDAMTASKTKLDQANAVLAAGQGEVKAKDLLAKTLAEASAKVKVEADKVPADKALQAALAKANEFSTLAANDLAAVQKNVVAMTTAMQAATAEMTAAQKKVTDTQAMVAQAPQALEAKKAALAPVQAKSQADLTALTQAEATLKAAGEKVDRLKAALTAPKK